MNSKAEVIKSDFYETVIRSDYRYNYDEVQQIIENKNEDLDGNPMPY